MKNKILEDFKKGLLKPVNKYLHNQYSSVVNMAFIDPDINVHKLSTFIDFILNNSHINSVKNLSFNIYDIIRANNLDKLKFAESIRKIDYDSILLFLIRSQHPVTNYLSTIKYVQSRVSIYGVKVGDIFSIKNEENFTYITENKQFFSIDFIKSRNHFSALSISIDDINNTLTKHKLLETMLFTRESFIEYCAINYIIKGDVQNLIKVIWQLDMNVDNILKNPDIFKLTQSNKSIKYLLMKHTISDVKLNDKLLIKELSPRNFLKDYMTIDNSSVGNTMDIFESFTEWDSN